jgi:hypothetical protein
MPIATTAAQKHSYWSVITEITEGKIYSNCQNLNVYSLFFPGRRVRAHLQNPATKCDFPIGYFIFLLTL